MPREWEGSVKQEIEGDPKTWHIRLYKRLGTIEVWRLFYGDNPESSAFSKATVAQWRDDELAKEKNEDYQKHPQS
jgi:hypothetical protein